MSRSSVTGVPEMTCTPSALTRSTSPMVTTACCRSPGASRSRTENEIVLLGLPPPSPQAARAGDRDEGGQPGRGQGTHECSRRGNGYRSVNNEAATPIRYAWRAATARPPAAAGAARSASSARRRAGRSRTPSSGSRSGEPSRLTSKLAWPKPVAALRTLAKAVSREITRNPGEVASRAVAQRLALDKGHDVEQEGVGLARVEQREDVRMLEIGGELDLGQEPSAPITAASPGRRSLRATLRSCRRSWARYTVAIPPAPISPSIRSRSASASWSR